MYDSTPVHMDSPSALAPAMAQPRFNLPAYDDGALERDLDNAQSELLDQVARFAPLFAVIAAMRADVSGHGTMLSDYDVGVLKFCDALQDDAREAVWDMRQAAAGGCDDGNGIDPSLLGSVDTLLALAAPLEKVA